MVGFLPRSPGDSVPTPGRTSSCEELAAGFMTSPVIEATVETAKGMVDGSLCDTPNKLLTARHLGLVGVPRRELPSDNS